MGDNKIYFLTKWSNNGINSTFFLGITLGTSGIKIDDEITFVDTLYVATSTIINYNYNYSH